MAMVRPFFTPLLAATLAATATLPAFAFEDDRLTIWMGDNKGQEGIRAVADQFLEETGIEVEVVFPDNLTDRFQQAAGSGQGPDIVIWAHDRMGEWAQSGLLKPIAPSDSFREAFYDFTWEASLWNGDTYAYPISVESLGLIYNKALVETPPESFAELMELDATLAQEGKKVILFDYSEPYYGWTLLAANGGYPFKQTDSGYDVSDIGVNNAGALQGAELLVELIDSGVVPRGTDYNLMDTRFNQGEVATMISGPWAWPNLERSGIDYGVALLPRVGDERARPMFGVTAAMINSATPNDFLAVEFLENYLLSEEGMRTFNSDGSLGAVAHINYQAELADNPNIAATLENAEVGMPMPNIPEMGAFWAAMEPALQKYQRPATKFVAGFIGSPTMNFMPAELLSGTADGCRVKAAGVGEVSLPQAGDAYSKGSSLTLGVRPEHLRLEAPQGDNCFDIVNVEYLGNEVYVYLEPKEGSTLLIHRSEAPSQWQEGQQVSLVPDTEHVHLFDESGAALILSATRTAA